MKREGIVQNMECIWEIYALYVMAIFNTNGSYLRGD